MTHPPRNRTPGRGNVCLLRGIALLLALLIGCGGEDEPMGVAGAVLPLEELQDPETCKECHEDHHREWASSMHAYAAEDPIFLAMNRRGQEETGGELGDFCIGCHAPMAVRMGMTTDGMNLDEVPDKLEGVTCYFCHNVESVAQNHDNPLGLPANNPLVLANDAVMRGGIDDPKRPSAHEVAYSDIHDGNRPESGQLCGPCHDIVTPAGVHLERTFKEWQDSVFSRTDRDSFDSCIGCHMDSRDGLIAKTDEVPLASRTNGFHSHLMPGVDTALTPFPDIDVQVAAIECALAEAVQITELQVSPDGMVTMLIEANVGHGWPTGSAQDRRAWIEVKAFDAAGNMRVGIGAVADNEPLPTREQDPQLIVMRDFLYDSSGQEVHMFWEAAPSDMFMQGYESTTLPITPPGEAGAPPAPHFIERTVRTFMNPARVEARVKIRPLGFELIDDLVASGHLPADNDFKSKIKTYTLNLAQVVWTLEDNGPGGTATAPAARPLGCPSPWLCKLYPENEQYCR